MKKTLAMLLMICMVLSLVACSSTGSEQVFGISRDSHGETHSYSAGEAAQFFSGMELKAVGLSESEGVSYSYTFSSDPNTGKIIGFGRDSNGVEYQFEFYLNGMSSVPMD